MSSEPPPEQLSPAADGPAPSRRGFLIGGGLAIAAAATGGALMLARGGAGPTAATVSAQPSPPAMVTQLLRTRAFTVAHRGGSVDWPEMSLFAYRHAVALGVDALEISLARTSDGVWFGLHDATLDRTSGTTDFVASEHSWAEISPLRIAATTTNDPRQASQPYLRFEDLVHEFGTTHAIFVDPKAVASRHYPELLEMMKALVPEPTETFVAKGLCTSTPWADAAHASGYRSWGFYYGSAIDADAKQLPSTQAHWSMLGLDYGASDAAWTAVSSYGKPVLGHVIANKVEQREALAHGAAGLVVSGVTEVLG